MVPIVWPPNNKIFFTCLLCFNAFATQKNFFFSLSFILTQLHNCTTTTGQIKHFFVAINQIEGCWLDKSVACRAEAVRASCPMVVVRLLLVFLSGTCAFATAEENMNDHFLSSVCNGSQLFSKVTSGNSCEITGYKTVNPNNPNPKIL